ncbi:hypothetical protein BsIDN1_03720 [Bacillus safensis]|uniref:UPF0033 domain-containing protein n=1 Tax=Bacillus safensis TaxID=561879 RepID=A0A5S9M3P3_BACIA|nr:hypothetical protein BsIDN1_03720 [Bacillus safensis]
MPDADCEKKKKQMNELLPGDVLEVQATDKGSAADLAAWSKSAGHEFLGTRVEGQVLHHLIRKGGAQEEEGEPMISEISLNAFQQKVKRRSISVYFGCTRAG